MDRKASARETLKIMEQGYYKTKLSAHARAGGGAAEKIQYIRKYDNKEW